MTIAKAAQRPGLAQALGAAMQFREYDFVRVTASIPATRIDRNAGEALQPKIGDIGTILIVHSIQAGEEPAFIVESVGPDGSTLWMADILASELERVSADGKGGT